MSTTAVKPEITQFATRIYEEQEQDIKQDFIDSLAQEMQESFDKSESEIARGEFMDMATFKKKLYAINLSK